jgi:hypothetical protein
MPRSTALAPALLRHCSRACTSRPNEPSTRGPFVPSKLAASMIGRDRLGGLVEGRRQGRGEAPQVARKPNRSARGHGRVQVALDFERAAPVGGTGKARIDRHPRKRLQSGRPEAALCVHARAQVPGPPASVVAMDARQGPAERAAGQRGRQQLTIADPEVAGDIRQLIRLLPVAERHATEVRHHRHHPPSSS